METSKNNKMFVRSVLYIIISVIAVVLITSFLVWYYSNTVLEKYQYDAINNYQKNVLTAMENNGNQFPKAIMQIFEDADISRFLRYDETTETEKAAAMRKLSDYLFYYNLNSVQIIHRRSNSYWTSDDITCRRLDEYGKDSNIEEILELYQNGKNFVNGSNLSNPVKGLFYTYSNFQGYIFILNINVDEYNKNILQYASPFECNTWIYCSGLLSVTDSKEVTDVVKKYNLDIEQISEDKKFNINKMLFVVNRSGNYTAITMVPYREFQREVYKNIFMLVIIALSIILICILSLFIHTRYFKIMKNIYDEKINEVQNKLEIGTWQNIMYKIFVGIGLTPEERKIVIKMINKTKRNKYMPMLVLVDNYNTFGNKALQTAKLDISRIISEIFDYTLSCYTVQLEKERIGIILCYDKAADFDINESIRSICGTVKEQLGVTVSVITEKADADYEYLEDKVVELFKIAQYHFISKAGCIISADEIGDVNDKAEYPVEIQQSIALALKQRNDDDFEDACNKFVEFIKANNYLMGRKWSTYLYMNIMGIFTSNDVNENAINSMDFSSIWEVFEELREKAYSVSYDELGDFKTRVQELIALNYANSDYNISAVADSLGINTVYAGQKFKKVFDKTFNTYLAEYRCKKATEFLLQTNKKSVEIAALCGFKSDTYYNYIFKKYMKTTPQQYRKAYKKYI